MPELIADALAAVGEDWPTGSTLTRLDPAYRAHFPDGSTLDVIADTVRMAAEIARVCGAREADGYLRFVDVRPPDCGSWSATTSSTATSTRPRRPGHGRTCCGCSAPAASAGCDTKIGQFFRDPRTQRIFSFQACTPGSRRTQALAIYAVIAYLDSVAGVYFPRGGMHAVPQALAGAAEKHGVTFRYGTTVDPGRDVTHGRARAVITADGERIPADVVVLNPDLPVAYRDLLPGRRRRRAARPAALLAVRAWCCTSARRSATRRSPTTTSTSAGPGAGTFDEVIRQRSADERPVAAGDQPDPDRPDARAGRPADLLRARAGAEPGRRADAAAGRGRPRRAVRRRADGDAGSARLRRLRRRHRGVAGRHAGRLGRRRAWPPARRSRPRTRSRQTGPFRPGNLHPALANVVFVGSGTQPGVGVPMVLISGKLAAAADHRVSVVTRPRSSPRRTGRRRRHAPSARPRSRDAHRAPGRLHRAFSVVLIDPTGRMLLQQRAAGEDPVPAALGERLLRPPGAGRRPSTAAARRRLARSSASPLPVSCVEVGVYTYQRRRSATAGGSSTNTTTCCSARVPAGAAARAGPGRGRRAALGRAERLARRACGRPERTRRGWPASSRHCPIPSSASSAAIGNEGHEALASVAFGRRLSFAGFAPSALPLGLSPRSRHVPPTRSAMSRRTLGFALAAMLTVAMAGCIATAGPRADRAAAAQRRR